MSDTEHHHHLELDPHRGWKCTLCGEEFPLDYRGGETRFSRGGILPSRQTVNIQVRTNENGLTECRLPGERWAPVITSEQIKRFTEGKQGR